MDNEWKKMLEQNLYEYLQNVKFDHPDFSIKELKQNLKSLLGTEPAVNIKWNTYDKINELKKAAGAKDYKETIDEAQQIDIIIVDENQTPINFKFIL